MVGADSLGQDVATQSAVFGLREVLSSSSPLTGEDIVNRAMAPLRLAESGLVLEAVAISVLLQPIILFK